MSFVVHSHKHILITTYVRPKKKSWPFGQLLQLLYPSSCPAIIGFGFGLFLPSLFCQPLKTLFTVAEFSALLFHEKSCN